MRLDGHLGDGHLARKVRPLAPMPGVHVIADIVPRPAVEGAFLNRRREVGREIVAEPVALVDGAPRHAGCRVDRQRGAVAKPRRVDPPVAALGIEFQHVGASGLVAPGRPEPVLRLPRRNSLRIPARQVFRVVAARPDRDVHPPPVGRKGDVAGPMEPGLRAEVRHDGFGRAARIGVAEDCVRRADIDVARVRSRRMEGDAERAVQPVGEGRTLAVAEAKDRAGAALGDKDVPVGRNANDARNIEAVGEQRHRKPRRYRRRRAGGLSNYPRGLTRRRRGERRGEVRFGDLAPHARRVGPPVAERRSAGENARLLLRPGRGQDGEDRCRHDCPGESLCPTPRPA